MMEENKTEGQKLLDSLGYTSKNAWEKAAEEERKNVFEFCEGYKKFLDKAKTEREFVDEVEVLAVQKGYISLDDAMKKGTRLGKGTKVYHINRNKSAVLAIIGSKPIEEGIKMVGAHVDSPRLDLKPNPLYEDTGMALFKTHYYGGIKKYQWVTIPLAIHGVVIKQSGEKVKVVIGEDENDPVFTVTDLLPHLAQDQMQKKMTDGISGEALNLLTGSIPYKDEKVKDKVKLNILKLLNDKYGIVEEDFASAELEIVPAFKAKDVGLDKSFVGGYGQDDRVCAYTALRAILDLNETEYTTLCILTDKEEIGSVGNTGAESVYLENVVAYLCSLASENYSDLLVRRCLNNSKMLSADVNAGVDPNWEGVQDKKNASFMGKGVILQKYTGSRGKSGASDANPEFIAELRKLFNEKNILWQTAEMGKIDLGGGGTIALYIANLGVEVIDCGVPLLSMHSPFEISSKIDIYTIYRAYTEFMKN